MMQPTCRSCELPGTYHFMKRKSYSTRRFLESDANGILGLLECVWKRKFSREWWNWKYESNPAGFSGEKGDIWIAENACGEIVGHWAVLPQKMKLGSTTITAASAVDAATHPNYRRLGINGTLVERVFSDIQDRYAFVFSFPKEVLYRARLAQGWKQFPVAQYLMLLNPDIPFRILSKHDLLVKTRALRWVARAAFKANQVRRNRPTGLFVNKPMRDFEIRKVSRFPREIQDFWKQARSGYELCLDRTAAFLNWRFSEHFGNYLVLLAQCNQNKDIAGYTVLRKTSILDSQNALDVLDLQTFPSDNKTASDLIDTAIRFAKNEELDLIRCWVPPWHMYAAILSRKGFVDSTLASKLLRRSQPSVFLRKTRKEVIIPRIQRWFCTLADTDYA
jgi:GNAT superfamily N-acetyltransferase